MNNNFPLFSLNQPEIATRRQEKPRLTPLPPEIRTERKRRANHLSSQVKDLSNKLQELSDEQFNSLLFKIEHEKPVKIPGLKEIAEPTEKFTLAVPANPREKDVSKKDNLAKKLNQLQVKIEDFGTGELNEKNQAPNEQLVGYIQNIEEGKPKDRLCQSFFEQYDQLIQQDWVICEIEMMSLQRGKNQQTDELQEIRSNLQKLFRNGIDGNIFEHEEIKGTCRAVIRCKGKIFKHLVEDREWQTKIFWFDARPKFETFHATLKNFSIEKLGKFIPPSEDAPIVCIVDSGVTVGNPFLKPVVREELCHSFLTSHLDNPYDENGHGSGIASLASYYSLGLYSQMDNEAKVWIASARVLDQDNEIETRDEDEHENLRLFSKILTEVVETFEPHGVRIFNLSVGILNRQWNAESKRTVPRRSWIARTIDKLSREYDVVFVISSGNILPQNVKGYWEDNKPYPKYFLEEESKILDPSQAALALTVGSIARSTTITGNQNIATAKVIAEQTQPSPFTRCGPGISKEIKPELVEYGGNYLVDEDNSVRLNPGTNVVMASHQLTPAIAHHSGTSFAVPRVVHKIALILKDYLDLSRLTISKEEAALRPKSSGAYCK